MKRNISFVLLLALSNLPAMSHAAGGALEINQDCAAVGCFAGDSAGFPITISHPGSYVLTSDLLTTPANVVAISVTASPVDIDLGGHTIDGGGACGGSPVTGCTTTGGFTGISQSNADPPGVLHIHDGTIRGFTNSSVGVPSAIYLGNAGDGTVLERLNVLETAGIGAIMVFSDAAGLVRLRDSNVSRDKFYGVACASGNLASLSIERSQFSASGNVGVSLGLCKNVTITESRFYGNAGYGVLGIGASAALGSNTFSGNNSAGVQYSVATLKDMGGNVCFDHACP